MVTMEPLTPPVLVLVQPPPPHLAPFPHTTATPKVEMSWVQAQAVTAGHQPKTAIQPPVLHTTNPEIPKQLAD